MKPIPRVESQKIPRSRVQTQRLDPVGQHILVSVIASPHPPGVMVCDSQVMHILMSKGNVTHA